MKTTKHALAGATGLIAILLVFSTPASADSTTVNDLTLTLNTTNLTVTEGQTLVLSYTLSFNFATGTSPVPSDISLDPVATRATGVSGDPTDVGTLSELVAPDCNLLIGMAAAPCPFSFNLNTPMDINEPQVDSGVTQVSVGFTLQYPDGTTGKISLADNVTVNDPSVSTPEPSSLILFGTGLLGLDALRRRARRAVRV